jgi:GDP-L-fucose synthase
VGDDISVAALAHLVKEVVGFEGRIVFDSSKPDGTPRKLMDVTKINQLGWKANIELKEGIINTYELVKSTF